MTSGWSIDYNELYDIVPTKESVESVNTCFNEDLFQFTHSKRNRLIDLSWLPENDWSEGAFVLVVYEGDFRGNLLFELRTKNKERVVCETNRLLAEISGGKL